MSEWLPRRPVVPAPSPAKWRVKRNGKYLTQAQIDAKAAQKPSDRRRKRGEARAQRRADHHARGEPCESGACTMQICAEAFAAKKEAETQRR